MKILILALLAVLPTIVSAQAPPVPWNAAEFTVVAPTTYFDGSPGVDVTKLSYQLETIDPGKTDWRVVTTFKTLVHIQPSLLVGVHQYRVRVLNSALVPSDPSNTVTKTILLPATSAATITVR